ncbi:flavohemoglobin expression-modulating QEGLA motif protein [Sessilibacter sp. MAH2]
MIHNSTDLEKARKLDSALYDLVRDVDVLEAIAPQNFQEQKKIFFESNFSINPEFTYKKSPFNSFQKKRALYNLPVEDILDEDLAFLYAEVIESYVDKLDQSLSIGSPDFLYDSLRYFGEPNEKDLNNANFILHLPDDLDEEFCDIETDLMNAQQIQKHMDEFAGAQGYEYKIKIESAMIANAVVSGRTLKINQNAKIPETEVYALAHHELGVHLVTTLNAAEQPLKIMSLGCPVNTKTQEGIAILCEYLAGFLTIPRLKVLALRVIAVDSMINEKDFKQTFLLLKETHGVEENLAYTITARVYRGGGYTKDYLYLRGLRQMLNAYEKHPNFQNLLIGKVSFEYIDVISRLVEKHYLNPPKFISPAIAAPGDIDAVKQFVAHSIK